MPPPLRIGIAGLGTVGAAVITLLDRQAEALRRRTGRQIAIAGISACRREKQRGINLASFAWFDDCVALARSPGIDLFVELIGGEEGAALAAAEAALDTGKSFVTANKALLAKHGMRLAALAEEKGVALAFEASVAGGIPIVKTLREGLAGNSIERVYGILNGTSNYILTRMESESLTFAQCLGEAQRLGYAEADPTFDIGGFDTAHKLAILTSLAFGTIIDPAAIAIEGIEFDHPCRSRSGGGTRLPRQASRCRAAHALWHRTARASDHGAEIHGDRPGHGRHQRGHDRRRRGA